MHSGTDLSKGGMQKSTEVWERYTIEHQKNCRKEKLWMRDASRELSCNGCTVLGKAVQWSVPRTRSHWVAVSWLAAIDFSPLLPPGLSEFVARVHRSLYWASSSLWRACIDC
jgi:hypothetical protein